MLLLSKFRISGHSMESYLKENDLVFVSNIFYLFRNPGVNDIVVFKLNDKILVKRIIKIEENKYFVAGDNKKDSFDSNFFGHIKKSQILGKIFYKL